MNLDFFLLFYVVVVKIDFGRFSGLGGWDKVVNDWQAVYRGS
jgi:hypothetical protein